MKSILVIGILLFYVYIIIDGFIQMGFFGGLINVGILICVFILSVRFGIWLERDKEEPQNQ